MNPPTPSGVAPWADAVLAAALFAVDPVGTGGVALRGLPGPVRERWLALLGQFLPPAAPRAKVPLHVSDGRLLGGLDLAATLRAGRPLAERGLLAEADGGIVELAMAERMAETTVARLTAVLDTGEVLLERDGIAARARTRFGVIAKDEGIADDERMSGALLDRLAFHLDLSRIGVQESSCVAWRPEDVRAARAGLGQVSVSAAIAESLCAAALVLGVDSLRGSLLALRVARAAAALAGRTAVADEDLADAARLVLAPRATRLPAAPPPEAAEPEQQGRGQDESPPESSPDQDPGEDAGPQPDRPLEERLLEAARAALPADVLERLRQGPRQRARSRTAGRAGTPGRASLRGRPIGVRRGELRPGVRLNVVETLRAAAPWQRLRRREAAGTAARVRVRREDFRVTRFKHRSESTTIFVVDASGSAALHRLAEAKGAVELLLAACYVRRDRVALVAFRGQGAELLLPPTRSLVRAKRSLAGLPGGGGTPLASGIDTALLLADGVRRRGGTPTIVLLTDGRANVTRDGQGGRGRAAEEALTAARLVRAAAFKALLVDTSPRPRAAGQELAAAMGALYLPLPYADAATLADAVQSAQA